MTAFIAAMTLYPDIQKRAQQEVDDFFRDQEIVKPTDQTLLSYVDSLIKEVLCWAPPAPLSTYNNLCHVKVPFFSYQQGLPHRVIQSDIITAITFQKVLQSWQISGENDCRHVEEAMALIMCSSPGYAETRPSIMIHYVLIQKSSFWLAKEMLSLIPESLSLGLEDAFVPVCISRAEQTWI